MAPAVETTHLSITMPLHPMLVHLPIALAVLMPLLTIGILIAWWRGALPRRTWLIAVALQAVLVGSGFVAMQTGEADEERVEGVVPDGAIEAHEEAAEIFLIGSALVLGIALLAGVLRNPIAGRSVASLATAGTLVVLLLGYRVGDAGGRLVYEHGAATAAASGPPHDDVHDDD